MYSRTTVHWTFITDTVQLYFVLYGSTCQFLLYLEIQIQSAQQEYFYLIFLFLQSLTNFIKPHGYII